MDDEIDLRDIFRILWKRRLLIIGVIMVSLLIAGAINFTRPPVYKVSSIMAVGNFEDPVYTSQASAKSIMLSDEFLLEVFENIRPNATGSGFAAFKGSIDVEPVKDSDRLIEISVKTPKGPQGKVAIENIIRLYANRSEDGYRRHIKILSDQLAANEEQLKAMDEDINLTLEAVRKIQDLPGSSDVVAELRFSRTLDQLTALQTQRSVLGDKELILQKQMEQLKHLEIVQPPREPLSPVETRKALNMAIAGMLGLMIGIFAAFIREGLSSPVEPSLGKK